MIQVTLQMDLIQLENRKIKMKKAESIQRLGLCQRMR